MSERISVGAKFSPRFVEESISRVVKKLLRHYKSVEKRGKILKSRSPIRRKRGKMKEVVPVCHKEKCIREDKTR